MSFLHIAAAAAALLSLSFPAAGHRTEVTIMEECGCVTGEGEQLVQLNGVYENKGLYAQELTIRVLQKETGEEAALISPEQNAGYLPAILLADFTGDGICDIFLGMDSGGSGGFGYYYIYDLSAGDVRTIFDFGKLPMPYTAEYADSYRLTVTDGAEQLLYSLDIRLRGTDYLNGIYREDGALKEPLSADVSPVNAVFPFFVNTERRCHLLVMRRITGLYNADAFGYTMDFMRYDGEQFVSYFQCVSVYGTTVPK